MIYSKEIEVRYEVDVLVVGGGAAGVAASVSAARSGKSVLVCESGGCFGGVGTSGLVPSFANFTDGDDIIVGGIGLEIRRNVSMESPISTYWTPINVEELKREYDRIVSESGAKILFFTNMCDAVSDGDGKLDYVVFTSKTGIFAVKAKMFVDCTGDGELCAFAGADFEKGDEDGNVMPPTLCSVWTGLDTANYVGAGTGSESLERAIKDGVFTNADRHLPGLFVKTGEYDGITGGNLGHIFGNNPLSNESLTEAMICGRRQMLEYRRFYREYVKGCENLTLISTGNTLGVRESRRIVCDYMLNVNDFLGRAVFEDDIARYNYPVDIHVMNTSDDEYKRFREEYEKNMKYKHGETYGIPYRSLVVKGFSNLLVAGRCIGTDRSMEATVRVMPCCFMTGQAAGTAAAMATELGDTRRVDSAVLRERLIKDGAII
ncbi:MAG: FAD-dependent oxidoreductase [Clostridia bacterium]|nr:FAD-dependent oxidoreductase [Clostridia bacterium]